MNEEEYGKVLEARAAANADPGPGPLLEAFLPETLRAAGFELRAVVPSDLMILKKIGSPLIKVMENEAKGEENAPVNFEDEDIWEMLWLWTRPVCQARAVLAREGRAGFTEVVLRETADVLPLEVLGEAKGIMGALVENFRRSFRTGVKYKERAREDGTVFTRPPAQTTG